MSELNRQDGMLTLPRQPLGGTLSVAAPLFGRAVELTPEQLADREDDRIVIQVISGQKELFETLVRRHYQRVTRVARHFFNSSELVEDITQDTFLKAYISLPGYKQGACFKHWLAKIAVNNCYDELRRKKKKAEILLSDLANEEDHWLENKLAGRSIISNRLTEAQANSAALTNQLLQQLSPEDQVVLTLLHAQDYSVKEISEYLGWSEAKVKIRAFRARQNMRKAHARLSQIEARRGRQGQLLQTRPTKAR